MLCEKCLGLPIWIWLVVIGIVVFSCYKTTEKFANAESENKSESQNNNVEMAQESSASQSQSQPKLKVYNFTAPSWCGYSRAFMDTWNEFAQVVKSKYPNVQAITMEFKDRDNTPQENMKLADEFGVRGYPTVMFEVLGKEKPEIIEYNGNRSVEALEDAVKTILSKN
jgi:thiol-disulfide isomerase/thioredoxin